MEEESSIAEAEIEVQMEMTGIGEEGRRYGREEMYAIYWGMGDGYYSGVAEVCVALEPVSQDLYDMDVEHGPQKTRHKTIDRRQRGKKSRSSSIGGEEQVDSFEEELMLELGLDLPSRSPSRVPESEVYEEDSEEEVESFQPLAFVVEGEPNFESGEPEDGWEYLRRVKWEFARCPKIVVAEIDPSKFAEQTPYMPSLPSVSTCSPHLLPKKEWETEFLADFSNLRLKYAGPISEERKYSGPLPSIHNQVGWETFCFGRSTSPVEETVLSTEEHTESVSEVIDETILSIEEKPESLGEVKVEDVETETDKNPDILLHNLDSETEFPALVVNANFFDEELRSSHESGSKLQKVAREESVVLMPLMKSEAKDSVKRKPPLSSGDLKGPKPPLLGILMILDEVKRAALLRYHIAWLERVDGLPEGRAEWLFALSVVVDKPIDSQTMAAYRALLRRCASLRASKTSAEDEELYRLNVLITIAGRYFGQAEDALS